MIILVLLTVFLTGRYGWKLFGFNACESAGIEKLEVADGQVRITGFYPGSFLQGFLGHHAQDKDGKLYVGFKFSDMDNGASAVMGIMLILGSLIIRYGAEIETNHKDAKENANE